MMNAVNMRPLQATRMVWPPEALNAELHVDDFVLRPLGLKNSPLISPGMILPIVWKVFNKGVGIK